MLRNNSPLVVTVTVPSVKTPSISKIKVTLKDAITLLL